MAGKGSKKGNKTQKKSSTARNTSKKKQTQNKQQGEGYLDDVIIWTSLAVCIYMFISNFGVGGQVGEKISGMLMGGFGLAGYIFPVALFILISFFVSNYENVQAYTKCIAAMVLYVIICTLLQVTIDEGGALGKTIEHLLIPAFGVAGTYVILLLLGVICFVIITEKSALRSVKRQGNLAYTKAKEDAMHRREAALERRKQREAELQSTARNSGLTKNKGNLRREKYVEGVSFDTTLKNPVEEKKPVVEEIAPVTDEFDFLDNARPASMEIEPPVETPAEETLKKTSKKRKSKEQDIQQAVSHVEQEIVSTSEEADQKAYRYPSLSLLKKGKKNGGESDATLRETARKLQQTLQNFGVNVTITNVSCGPAVTRYELQPEMGVKVSKIVGLADDIKLNLAAADIRIEAPIPGKAAVGIEVPNKENSAVMLRDLLETKEFQKSTSKLSFAAGKDIAGKVVVTDIAKMPHLLIAGSTGSGKSVCINTLIMSILYKATPDEVKLIMIDPKVVELSVYNGIPHLMIPVVTDPKKAAGALNWAVAEMTRRYQSFAEYNVRDMKGYNEKIKSEPPIDGVQKKPMSQIVIIVDELADLMMVASGEVEEAICRLAQLARAAGIHLVVATQRPSVNVITGLIKANMPSRIAFAVSSGVDSRTIIDMNGAEKLLGKGDMLFYPQGYPKPARVQGSFVTDEEVQAVVSFLKENCEEESYDEAVVEQVNTVTIENASSFSSEDQSNRDAYFAEAGRLIIEKEKASIGMLQRAFKIGFNRAARIMDQLCEAGVVGGEEGTKPRKVLMSKEAFEQYINENKL